MAKYKEKLSKEEVGRIFYRLCFAISELDSIQESADFLKDLLSYQESEMIAKRLRIAELVLDGNSYADIEKQLKVGSGTIARVQEWIKISGEGYRKAVEKLRRKCRDSLSSSDSKRDDWNTWGTIKRKYPMHYWPEILIEDLIRNANRKQKEKIKRVIGEMEKMKEKTALFKNIKRIMTK